jgi:pimeloyl-ACP methyl ester carboxylesterase
MSVREGYALTEDGVRLFFQTVGTGPQTVLIPNGISLVDDFARFANGRTLVFFDVRNRGRSDQVADTSKQRGVQDDVDDLDAVRRHFDVSRVDLIGHSYVGITVVLYALKYPVHASRVVQIGPMQPHAGSEYPPQLMCRDETFHRVMAALADLEKERQTMDRIEFCRRFWAALNPLYVTNAADVDKLPKWDRYELANEASLRQYMAGVIMPSIQALNLTAAELASVNAPVLTIHGTKDRSAPYGGGRDWALALPSARLLAVEGAGHAPWIESPRLVFDSIETFLNGAWPEAAQHPA